MQNEGLIKAEQINIDKKLRAELVRFKEKQGLSWARIGRSLGVSGSTISLYSRNDYPGDIDGLEEKIENFLAIEKKRAEISSVPNFVMISAAKIVFEVCEWCRLRGSLGLLIGIAGVGKTFSLKYYARTSGVIFIRMNIADTISSLLRKIGHGLRTQPTRENTPLFLGRIIEKLHGSGRLLIFDEAQFLSFRMLETLRHILDESLKVGIVLAGPPSLYEQLVGRKSQLFDQLFTRVSIKRELPLLNLEDVSSILRSVKPDINDELFKIAFRTCEGRARTLVANCILADELARKIGKDIDVDIWKEAGKNLLTGRFRFL